ncbi:MAG: phytanoyl-CoA dioxygenase family protein [Fimbriimonadaceae bacterium]|nr:phytanoyl-CoA dioxygenase family protein [Fimbriimonadaceae bacterium]
MDPETMRARMTEDGYLFVPGFFEREDVVRARESVLLALRNEGALDPDHDWRKAVARPDLDMAFRPDLANGNPDVTSLLYSTRMMAFFGQLVEDKAMHYDYTWLRAMAPGRATEPHYDIVYMGRGTKRVYTAWVPMSDIPHGGGGLIVLENAHKLDELKATYGEMDVDVMCANKPGVRAMNDFGYHGYGALSNDPRSVAERFDRRWLAAEYQMGDLLTFSMFTLHASTDNETPFIRLSTDSRYQSANEPVDERWIGPNPIGHGARARRDLIC